MTSETSREPQDLQIIAEGLSFPEGPVAMADGSVLVVEIPKGRLTLIAPDGSTELYAEPGGGPNGAALGPDGEILLCNNGGSFGWVELDGLTVPDTQCPDTWQGGSIQRIDPESREVRTLYTECDGHQLRGPNDLVLDAEGGIWFTDHGIRSGRTSDLTGIYWAAPDGSGITEVAFPMESPNGIGLSPDGSHLYVAETNTGRVWAWEIIGSGQLGEGDPFSAHHGLLLAGLSRHRLLDSLAVDGEGWVCVGTLLEGGITSISPDGSEIETTPFEDPLVTNICFGPADPDRAFVTLSGTGKVASMPWHRPGLVPNFNS